MFIYLIVKMERGLTENFKAFKDHALAVEYRNNLAYRHRDDNYTFYIEPVELGD